MKRKFGFLTAPLLMSVFPLLSFYQTNISELSLKFLCPPLIYSLTFTLCFAVILFRLGRDRSKSSLIATLSLFIFFSYGHFSRYLDDKLFIPLPGGTVLGPDKIFIPLVIILYAVAVYFIITTRKSLKSVAGNISIILLVLVIWSGLRIYLTESRKGVVSSPSTVDTTEILPPSHSLPDIYYIIPDGFARQDVLEDLYGYDNSAFIAALKQMGFYVADHARSNYMHTYLSLPSTLNMAYLDDLPARYGNSPVDQSAAMDLLYQNQVAKQLRSLGYQTINFQSWWGGTGDNYPADVTYRYEKNFQILGLSLPASETDMMFLQTTLLNPLIREIRQDVYRGRILTVFEKLPDVAYLHGPKFVLAHITAPHPPYIFTRDGSPVPGSELENADEGVAKRSKYLDQLVFVSDRLLPVLQKIIANSATPPVIIVQSDHGPASTFGRREDWAKNYGPEGNRERSSILSAYFFPDGDYSSLYDSITPVNTFRLVLNKYFGQNLDLLPDRVYYTSYDQMYLFTDITK